jgi:hypothetical protein
VRSSAIAAAAVALAACSFTDVSRPIGLVVDGLSESDAANLAEAAECWNLRVGTQLVATSEAAALEQQIEVFYDDFTCVNSHGQYQAGMPGAIALCPQRYWRRGIFDLPFTLFSVVGHELGHALNIIGHPDPRYHRNAVMQAGGPEQADMFAPIDLEMFTEANPDFVPTASCERVIRSSRPGTDGEIGHCTCVGEP